MCFQLLLIEDDVLQVKLLSYQLRAIQDPDIPINLSVARDGVEAQEFLMRSIEEESDTPCPDLILLDLNMPRLPGQPFLEWLRRQTNDRIRCIPVIILTTSENTEEALSAYKQVISAFIPKPTNVGGQKAFLESLQHLWARISIRLGDVDDGRT